MKKLNNTKTKIHPSPPSVSSHLSLLPPAILTLVVTLSPQDREVLAYLIACCSANSASGPRRSNPGNGDHAPLFGCDCFRCYMSYWVRWDTSPNREVIHEIIDAYEDGQCIGTNDQKGSHKLKGKNGRKKWSKGSFGNNRDMENEVKSNVVDSRANVSGFINCDIEGGGDELEKGSVGKFVNFLGERIWGVLGYIMITYFKYYSYVL